MKQELIETFIEWRKSGCSLCSLSKPPNKCTHPKVRSKTNGKEIIFVGERPSFEDSDKDKIFSGPAGDLLKAWIEEAGINSYYMTNAVKGCVFGEKSPKKEDYMKCSSVYLNEELAILKPNVVVTLGAIAFQAVMRLDKAVKISDHVYKWNESHVLTADGSHKFLVMPVFHTSYILRGKDHRNDECCRDKILEANNKNKEIELLNKNRIVEKRIKVAPLCGGVD